MTRAERLLRLYMIVVDRMRQTETQRGWLQKGTRTNARWRRCCRWVDKLWPQYHREMKREVRFSQLNQHTEGK